MKHACRYALVRFMPYPETGEFANVGVVVMSPTARFFGYKLLDRVGRITAFFDELDVTVYKRARDTFRNELFRIGQMIERAFIGAVNGPSAEFVNFAFDELSRPREAIIYADTPRGAIVADPRIALEEYFDYYVGRSFATPVYQERMVEQRVRGILKAVDLQKAYQTRVLGLDIQARVPFVKVDETDRAVRLIKPLDLDRSDPTRLYDHGWEWLGKIKKLRRDKQLYGDALFVVRPPESRFDASAAVYADVKSELERADIQVAEETEVERIKRFAAEAEHS
ncbi:DUF3037 domain-containing protein [Paraburkholderia sp. SIMBA_009]|uniref:DUF3037 domain-containing protein n=3 Tax=Burkholderiaceae TaxID=119060 RepID=A0AAQ1JYJ0_9BURK|nr:DUF3037 domain-containing protein [Paraburkholderia tropica]QNB17351.1 DUF3037 domain-containing protein [Paraburkholderia tropica]RQN34166.1 DUF3037 domain-containing protein [Paraburkholderia tropica]SEK15198.1 Protein of unknown function [Paraburkholderia tropica]